MEKITNNFQWRWCILLCIKEGKNHRLLNKSDFCQALKLAQLLCTQTSLHLNKSAEMFNISALFQQTLTNTPLELLSPNRNSFHVHCKSSPTPVLPQPNILSSHPTYCRCLVYYIQHFLLIATKKFLHNKIHKTTKCTKMMNPKGNL